MHNMAQSASYICVCQVVITPLWRGVVALGRYDTPMDGDFQQYAVLHTPTK